MSRSVKGSKAPGWEFWSSRPMSLHANNHRNKTLSSRIERARNERAVRDEPIEPEYDPREDFCPICGQKYER